MAEWSNEFYREQLQRQKDLVGEVIDLVIKKHGGFGNMVGWIGFDTFEPGSSAIRLDGCYTLNDIEILEEILKLPSCEGRLKDFDFKKYEEIRDSLKAEICKRTTQSPPGGTGSPS